MNTETLEKKPVSISDLSPEDKKTLMAQLAAEEKQAKEAKKANTQTYKEMSFEFVNNNIDIFVHRQIAITADVEKLFSDYNTILALKAEVYGIDTYLQDSHTSTLRDGSASITIGHNVSIGFDGTESAGIQIIKDYIATLSDDDENATKLTEMVAVLLKENKKTGMLNPSSIIQLNQLREKMNSDKFNEGLDIIVEAQTKVKSSMYVSGWKFVEFENGIKKKLEFRFSI